MGSASGVGTEGDLPSTELRSSGARAIRYRLESDCAMSEGGFSLPSVGSDGWNRFARMESREARAGAML